MVLSPSLEVLPKDGGLKALLKSSSSISWFGTFYRPAASHLVVEGSTISADGVFDLGGIMNIKWAIDAVGPSVYLRRLYSSCPGVVCRPRLFLYRSR
jgi:hypothetical protein